MESQKISEMALHIGTSGWSYDHWNGVLYPPGIRPQERLAYYVGRYETVEVNSTYYHWPAHATFAGWFRRIPNNFLMTVKAPRGLTHRQRLYAPEYWLKRIWGGLSHLRAKCGVLLVQLPPDMMYDHARLEYFLQRNTGRTAGCPGVPPPELASGGSIQSPGATRRCLLRDERAKLPASCGLLHRLSTCVCMDLIHTTCMAAPIPRTVSVGGQSASGSGPPCSARYLLISTTTARAMLCATRRDCVNC